VLGATGLLGVSAILVALAMGADRVVAVGRSKNRLAAFDNLDTRIETATAPPEPGDPVDLVVSAIGGGDSRPLEEAIKGIRRFGSLVALGSLDAPIRIPDLITRDITVRGSLWFPRAVPSRLVRMIENGSLAVDRVRSHVYTLDNVAGAVEHGAKAVPPFEQVVVRP
jgi:threonine dehydrogenase-like Zn-dependent dehydrogenase